MLQHIHYQFKREEIEFPIIHRINSVFRRATNKWKVLYTKHSCVCQLNHCVDSTILCRIVTSRVFFPPRTTCSCGSRMSLSVRNGYVMLSPFALSLNYNTVCSPANNDLLWFLSSGHQRPDQQGVLSHACYTPRQARYRRCSVSCN